MHGNGDMGQRAYTHMDKKGIIHEILTEKAVLNERVNSQFTDIPEFNKLRKEVDKWQAGKTVRGKGFVLTYQWMDHPNRLDMYLDFPDDASYKALSGAAEVEFSNWYKKVDKWVQSFATAHAKEYDMPKGEMIIGLWNDLSV